MKETMAITKNIALIIASKGYQPVEYQVPRHIFETQGFNISVASDTIGNAIAKDGSTTKAELLVKDVDPHKFDAIVFIGGPGALEHLDNETSYHLIKKAYELGKIVAAICISTRIFAKSGILTGKDATGWNGDHQLDDIYEEYDVNLKTNDVIVDENIVTATGPAAAREFAENIVTLLTEPQ